MPRNGRHVAGDKGRLEQGGRFRVVANGLPEQPTVVHQRQNHRTGEAQGRHVQRERRHDIGDDEQRRGNVHERHRQHHFDQRLFLSNRNGFFLLFLLWFPLAKHHVLDVFQQGDEGVNAGLNFAKGCFVFVKKLCLGRNKRGLCDLRSKRRWRG